jgi:hypothetical protein
MLWGPPDFRTGGVTMISQEVAERLEAYNKARSQMYGDLAHTVSDVIAAADRLADAVEDDE